MRAKTPFYREMMQPRTNGKASSHKAWRGAVAFSGLLCTVRRSVAPDSPPCGKRGKISRCRLPVAQDLEMSVDGLVTQVHPADSWRQLGMKPHQPDVTSSDERWHSGEYLRHRGHGLLCSR